MVGDILQPTHLIFILLIALLVLGPKRLPEVGRSLGKGIRDFRGALSGLDQPPEPPAPHEYQPPPTEVYEPAAAPTYEQPAHDSEMATLATNIGLPAPEPPRRAPAKPKPARSVVDPADPSDYAD